MFSLYFPCLAEMPPKVDIATRWALEVATAAWQAEKKKKRPVVEAGPYELKRICRGPARPEVRSTPTSSPMAIPLATPLDGGSSAEPVRLEDPGCSFPESIRKRIRPAPLLGEVKRFDRMSLHKLGD